MATGAGSKVGAVAASLAGAGALVAALSSAPAGPHTPAAGVDSSAARALATPRGAHGRRDAGARTLHPRLAPVSSDGGPVSAFVDTDPIPISAPFEVSNVSTQAFPQILPSPEAVIFQPGGVRAGNVYTTLAQLDQVAKAMSGPFDLVCDTTYTNPCVLSGALTLSTYARWTCPNPPGLSGSDEWEIASGTTIVNPPSAILCNVNNLASATVTSFAYDWTITVNAVIQGIGSTGGTWVTSGDLTVDVTGQYAQLGSVARFGSSSSITVLLGAGLFGASAFDSSNLTYEYNAPDLATVLNYFDPNADINFGRIPGNPWAAPSNVNASLTPLPQSVNSYDATGGAQVVTLPASESANGNATSYQIIVADVGANSVGGGGITVQDSADAVVNPITGASSTSYTYVTNGESHVWVLVPLAGGNFAYQAGDSIPGYYATDGGGGGGGSVTWANDLAGSSSTHQYVAGISGSAGGGGTLPVNVGALNWGAAQSPALEQATPASDVRTSDLQVTSQAPFAGATTNQTPGAIDLNVPAPVGAGAYSGVNLAMGGNRWVSMVENATVAEIDWNAAAASPLLTQDTPASDLATEAFTITSQAPHAGATTNQAPGPIALNVPFPIDGGDPNGVYIEQGGLPWLKFRQTVLGASTVAEIVWQADAAAPEIHQFAPPADRAADSLTIIPQPPFATATTNKTPGAIVLDEPAPVDGGTHGMIQFQDSNHLYADLTNNAGIAEWVWAVDAPNPSFTQSTVSSGSGAVMSVQAQAVTAVAATGGELAIRAGNSTGDAGVGGELVLGSGTGQLTPDAGQGGPGPVLVQVGTGTAEQLQLNSSDYLALGGPISGTGEVAQSGFLRFPLPASSETLIAFRSGAVDLPALTVTSAGQLNLASTTVGNTEVMSQYGTSIISGSADFVISSGAVIQSYNLASWSLNSTTNDFAFTQGTASKGFRFLPSSGASTHFSGQVGGDPTTGSPLELGVSSAISLTGSYPMTITLTAAQVANLVVQFSGTPSALGQLYIVLPSIVGGASGYCEILDFTQASMAGWTGAMQFYFGSTSGPTTTLTNSAQKCDFLVCFDGTTARQTVMCPG